MIRYPVFSRFYCRVKRRDKGGFGRGGVWRGGFGGRGFGFSEISLRAAGVRDCAGAAGGPFGVADAGPRPRAAALGGSRVSRLPAVCRARRLHCSERLQSVSVEALWASRLDFGEPRGRPGRSVSPAADVRGPAYLGRAG